VASERAALRGLYAVTPETGDTAWLADRVAACVEGGARLVQYRAKQLTPERALEQARALAAICRRHGVPLIVNDSIDLAAACGAHGVHLGRDDADPRRARALLPGAIVGVSCYDDPARAAAAAAAGADYVAIGSLFASRSKPGATRAPLAALAEAKRVGGLPVAAIGGITPDNAPEVLAAGADMLAVIAAIFDADDVHAAARAFARLLDEAPTPARHERRQPRAV
jgi:thiamine-phosphate pyrophosphorylase